MYRKIKSIILSPIVNLLYSFSAKKYDILKINYIPETIDRIKSNKMSVCRYGDGEFKWILMEKQTSFQKNNVELSRRLKEILEYPEQKDENLLICIPYAIKSIKNNCHESANYWKRFNLRYFGRISRFLSNEYMYGNASFTRPYMPLKDKNYSKIYFDKIKEIWKGEDLLIVEGEYTRLGVGNDLFKSAKSVTRIICPNKDAFDSYFEILNSAKRNGKNKLVLIALGPTATIMAYDLFRSGFWAIDIGHIDIEYEWYTRKTKHKIPIAQKFTNEMQGDKISSTIEDENYLNQIKERIGC